MRILYAYITLLPLLLTSAAAGDCSCGTCQVVDCGAADDACSALDGDASCVSGSADWVCKLEEDCKASDCEEICEESSCFSSECDIVDEVCFHESSIITYRGKDYTYQELLGGRESECVIPHSPQSNGIEISTSCQNTIRVTETHLLATPKGYTQAGSLKVGDILFGSKDRVSQCNVLSVQKEVYAQRYFGLNCYDSEVLVNGILASTFGELHYIPSLYMKYTSCAFGIKFASKLGAIFSSIYFSIRL